MSLYPGTGVPRDNRVRGEAATYYGSMPAAALDPDSANIRADSVTRKHNQLFNLPSQFPKPLSSRENYGHPHQKDIRSNWEATKDLHYKRCRIQTTKKATEIELHQSTCLRLDATSESEFWILPDFEEWEVESESTEQFSVNHQRAEWAPLIARAVNSNLDRLRQRLEGDGWDFVSGKYGEDGEALETEGESEGSVDEEFDVVVLVHS